MSRPALLAAQLAQLSNPSASLADPDARDAELLGAHERGKRANRSGNGVADEEDVDREHYLDVGPSRMRKGEVEQTLLSDKYGGAVRGRQRIFEDDDEESEGDEGSQEGSEDEGEVDDEEEDEDDGEEDEDDGDEEEGSEEDDEDESEDGEEDDDEAEEEDEEAENGMPSAPASRKTLDPLAALRDARSKDVLKGQAIKRQRTLFETLTSTRITFQKALSSSTSTVAPVQDDEEAAMARKEALSSLRALNEKLFTLRGGLRLPGHEAGLGKRKRAEDGEENGQNGQEEQQYWLESARDSLTMTDATRSALVPILTKWSTKIQAASLAVGGKAAGSSKFLAGIKGQTGVFEAIEAGISAKRSADHQPLLQSIEPSYRLLLREIIAARTGAGTSASSLPISSYRLEKKKKRDAERGNSKGRKIRYTVHEKAQNFAVAQPVRGQWGEDQTDELFASLLGGVGMGGGRSEGGGVGVMGKVLGGEGEGLVELGGLRVF